MDNKYSTLGFDKIYVINLERRLDRKISLLKKYPNLDFTFIKAIDGKQLHLQDLISEKKLNSSFFDPHGMVTMGVFACALSHKKAWDQALQDGVENALFLEDDIFLQDECVIENQFTDFYKDILNEILDYDWDLLHLGKKHPQNFGINVGKYLTVPKFNSNYEGAHAYAATKEMIKSLSDNYLPVKYAADVYLEQYTNTHKVFTLKNSLIQQVNDLVESQNADSDTYYNDYRKSDGDVALSFDEEGKVYNHKLIKYLKHPKDLLDRYVELVFDLPKFGIQKFNPDTSKFNNNFFGISDLLNFLTTKLNEEGEHKMLEINPHTGETTFFFGCSNIFSYIYCLPKLKGKDKFNLDNNLTWKDILSAFNNNTYFFKNKIGILDNNIENQNLSLVYYNLRNHNLEDLKINLTLYSTNTKLIGGSNYDIGKKVINSIFNGKDIKIFKDNSWIVEI
jgi:GR25 family glycosyltransferase involved in LPS biosynthesis